MNIMELITFIKEHEESDDFTGGANKSQINFIQNELGVELPQSYKWFLTTYGSGGLFGVDILGVAKSNTTPVVVTTKRYRDLGLDKDLVVIEDVDEYAYCLDTSNIVDNECPIIAWNKPEGLDDYYTSENFYEFLSQRLLHAKEAWKEDF
ncbi:SMI1/KNR4 family protein [Virgibacillus halodenitrificans]|uniref:SMI1/KNR4 family protein n=1 Tax=Virgibacillus halodenitrificans TaxID=1482 RepID=UPI000EF47B99|nr:SMI1/KNR4 family protein [Virgibacillus halodenitrificans]